MQVAGVRVAGIVDVTIVLQCSDLALLTDAECHAQLQGCVVVEQASIDADSRPVQDAESAVSVVIEDGPCGGSGGD